jgi:hypothetical protein
MVGGSASRAKSELAVPPSPSMILGVNVSGTSSTTLVVLVVALRIGLANLAPISDCDEVYNYWEPMHFLRFGT